MNYFETFFMTVLFKKFLKLSAPVPPEGILIVTNSWLVLQEPFSRTIGQTSSLKLKNIHSVLEEKKVLKFLSR